MPKRTNDWQALVFFIKQHMAADAVVTESKMLLDQDTGREVEVDVCVQQTVGDDPLIVSVECVDWARPADVGWVEKMDGKHRGLPTNLLVLASRSGFTKNALAKARARNILAVSPKDITNNVGLQIASRLQALWIKTIQLAPEKCRVHVDANDAVDKTIVRVEPNHTVFLGDGRAACFVLQLVQAHLSRQEVVIDGFDLANRGDTDVNFVVEFSPRVQDRSDWQPLFLHHIDSDTLQRVTLVQVVGRCIIKVGEVPLTHGELQSAAFAWGRGKVSGQDALVAVVESREGRGSLSIRFIA